MENLWLRVIQMVRYVWQVADGKQLLTCRGTSWIVSVAFSPDGGILVSGSTDNTVKVWDASTGQCLSTLLGHSDRVRTVAISPMVIPSQ